MINTVPLNTGSTANPKSLMSFELANGVKRERSVTRAGRSVYSPLQVILTFK